MPVTAYAGEPFTVAVNAKYLRDVLNAAGTAQVWMGFTSNAAPIHIKPEPDGDLQFMVMPMHLPRQAPPVREAGPAAEPEAETV